MALPIAATHQISESPRAVARAPSAAGARLNHRPGNERLGTTRTHDNSEKSEKNVHKADGRVPVKVTGADRDDKAAERHESRTGRSGRKPYDDSPAPPRRLDVRA